MPSVSAAAQRTIRTSAQLPLAGLVEQLIGSPTDEVEVVVAGAGVEPDLDEADASAISANASVTVRSAQVVAGHRAGGLHREPAREHRTAPEQHRGVGRERADGPRHDVEHAAAHRGRTIGCDGRAVWPR